jgi:CBS domain-containing protein
MLSLTSLADPVAAIMQTNLAEARATDSLREAATTMAEDSLGALLVRRGTHVVGIISERDIVLAVGDGSDVDETRVLDVMTENLAGVALDATVGTALDRMAVHGVRHLVVRDGSVIKGVVSVRDVMRVLHAEVES